MIEKRLEDEELLRDPVDEESASSRVSPEEEPPEELRSGPPTDDDESDDEPEETLVTLEGAELRRAVEAVLFALSEPIAVRALAELVGVSLHEVRAAIEDLRLEYVDTGRAFRVEDIAGGVQLLTLKTYDPWLRKLRKKQREGRLSPAALEALAVIAYKQPIGKADLDAIRGVNCAPTLKTLLERGLVQVVGRGEGLGKPLLYGTTKRFLESFGIASIRELPQPESESLSASKPAAESASAEPDEGSKLYPEPTEPQDDLPEAEEDDEEDDTQDEEELNDEAPETEAGDQADEDEEDEDDLDEDEDEDEEDDEDEDEEDEDDEDYR